MLNVKLVQRVMAHIEAEPKRLDMGHWGIRGPYISTPCNTVGCFAGWTVLLSRPEREWDKAFDHAGVLIGFNFPEPVRSQAEELLDLNWRESNEIFMGDALEYPNGSKEQIEVLKDVINDVLKNRGLEERV